MSMLVQAAMTASVRTLETDATLGEAAAIMERGRFRHLPILRAGILAGIVSERDVRPPFGLRAETIEAFSGRPVTSVMRSQVITCSPDDPIEQAARLLFENKVGCLPVLRGPDLVGIITAIDIFRTFMQITGLLEPSTRIEIEADDMPATLAAIADVAARLHLPIAGLLTERRPGDHRRVLVVRFATIQGPRLIEALQKQGLRVVSPQPAAEG
jgi:acetoin utilization protein AcuB